MLIDIINKHFSVAWRRGYKFYSDFTMDSFKPQRLWIYFRSSIYEKKIISENDRFIIR